MKRFTPARRRRAFVGILIGSIVVLFAGCTEGERGIFATIAIEEEIKKNNLVENASVTGLVKTEINETEINETEYYVTLAGTKIFARPTAGSDWDEVRAPGSRLAQFLAGRDASDVPEGGTRGTAEEVYAVYQGSSSQANVLYRLTDSLNWDVAYTPTSADGFIDGMIGIENLLLASTDGDELLVWYSSVSGPPDQRISSGFSDGIRDGVYFAGTSSYYIIGKSGLLVEIANLTTTPVVTEFTPTNSSPQPVGIGVAPYDSGILAVTDKDGSVYVSNSGTPAAGAGEWDNAGGVGRPASDIVWVDELNNSGGFLISTTSDAVRNETGRGYYEGTISGSGGSYSISVTNDLGNNYEASDLAVASINQFRYFSDGVLFALTGGLGMWSTVYPPTADPTWRWE